MDPSSKRLLSAQMRCEGDALVASRSERQLHTGSCVRKALLVSGTSTQTITSAASPQLHIFSAIMLGCFPENDRLATPCVAAGLQPDEHA